MGREQELVLGAFVCEGQQLIAQCTYLKGDFLGFVSEAMAALPPNVSQYSLSWDRIMLVYRINGEQVLMLAAHETLGKAQAERLLHKLLDDLHAVRTSVPSGYSMKMEKKLRNVISSIKGEIPPRTILTLYPGAPKAFLTREDQQPEYVDSDKGRIRLQKALEEIDNSDDFEFSLVPKSDNGKIGGGAVNDSDEFTFTLPQKLATPASLYTSPHPRLLPSPSANAASRNANLSRESSKPVSGLWARSPGMSSDFTRMSARVSPDDSDTATSAALKGGITYVVDAIQSNRFFPTMSSDYTHMRAKSVMSSQYGGNLKDPRIRGQVGVNAPSGLSWEDEIASQLAAAGIKVSVKEEMCEGEMESPTVATGRNIFGFRPSSGGKGVNNNRSNFFHRGGGGNAGSGGNTGGGGFGRFTRGLKKTFNLQTEQDKLIG